MFEGIVREKSSGRKRLRLAMTRCSCQGYAETFYEMGAEEKNRITGQEPYRSCVTI